MVICYFIMLLMVTSGELSYIPCMLWFHTYTQYVKDLVVVCLCKQ